MGSYYKFANFTKKEILDLNSKKMSEIKANDFDRRLLVQYLAMECYTDCHVKFISDESGDWDKCAEFEDITCNVLVDMFEEGFVPDYWSFGWIYLKFKDAKRLDELAEWIKKLKGK
jgi:hypothetical protein